MNTASQLRDRASDLADAARSFQAAAQAPESYAAAPESLAALEGALGALSAAWYQLAAHASPAITARRGERASEVPAWPDVGGISRAQEMRLIGKLHDVAAAFARCARDCRDGCSAVTPIIARRVAATQAGTQRDEAAPVWLESRERPARRVA
jgi:hypothetical protein